MTASACSSPATLPDWHRIDTVCLDMDGTVLDHRFDNRLWLEELPRRWGERHGIEHGQAMELLKRRFDSARGTLEYYCVDHWSEQLDFDIPALKHELRDEIRYLDGADEFLDLLRASGKRVLLTTNAHPISLAVKDQYSRLARHFDALVSSHTLGVPKEHAGFWPELERAHAVDVRRTLFADDSAVVLEAALAAGVAWIYQILRPDSTRPPHPAVAGIPGVMRLADLGGSLRAQLSGVEAPVSAAPGDAPSA